MWSLEEDSEGEGAEEEHFDSEGLEAALLQLQEIATSPTLRPESFSPEVLDRVTRNTTSHATPFTSAHNRTLNPTPHDDSKLAAVKTLAASLAASLAATPLTGVSVVVREAKGVEASQLKRGGAAAVSAIFASPRNAFIVVDEGRGAPKLIVDPRFRDAFRVTPATRTYSALVESLPEVFMGSEDQLRQIVKLLATQIARSYGSLGLVPPPWRRHSALLARWLPSSFIDHPVTLPDESSPFAFGSVNSDSDDGEEVTWRPKSVQQQQQQGRQRVEGGVMKVVVAGGQACLPHRVVHGFAVSAF